VKGLQDIAILMDVLEESAAKIQHIFFSSVGSKRLALASKKRCAQMLQPAQQQAFLAAMMRVKRRTPDIRMGDDIRDTGRFVSLLQNERVQRHVK
jgi:hypothetical protein